MRNRQVNVRLSTLEYEQLARLAKTRSTDAAKLIRKLIANEELAVQRETAGEPLEPNMWGHC